MTDVDLLRKPRIFSVKQQCKAIKDIKCEIRQMFENAERFCWEQKFLLSTRTRMLYETERWRRLPRVAQCEISGYWEAFSDMLWRKLKCMYLIRGKWFEPQQVGRSGDDGPQFNEAGQENCHYVYVVNTPDGPEYKIFF